MAFKYEESQYVLVYFGILLDKRIIARSFNFETSLRLYCSCDLTVATGISTTGSEQVFSASQSVVDDVFHSPSRTNFLHIKNSSFRTNWMQFTFTFKEMSGKNIYNSTFIRRSTIGSTQWAAVNTWSWLIRAPLQKDESFPVPALKTIRIHFKSKMKAFF